MSEIETVRGTVISVDFSEDDFDLVTIRVPTGKRWGLEGVTIVKSDAIVVARPIQLAPVAP